MIDLLIALAVAGIVGWCVLLRFGEWRCGR